MFASAAAVSAAPFLPGAGVLVVWAVLMPADGGYFVRDWAPAGIALLGLLALAIIGHGRLMPAGRAARTALGALLALVAFTFLSILWAPSPGIAWSTANQFLMVAVSVWTLALLPWTAGWAQALFGLFGVAAATAMGGSLLTTVSSDDLSRAFVEDRWAAPFGYPNGLANFGLLAALPLLAISAAPGRAAWIKAGALAVATFLGGCALLPQSRGSMVALVVAVPVLVALSPRRWSAVARVAVAAGALALASGPVFGVFDALAGEGTVVSGALRDALEAIALAALGAGVAGLALALLEARVPADERVRRAGRLSGIGAVVILGAGIVAVGITNADRIDRALDRQRAAWEEPRDRFSAERDQDERTRLLDADPLQRYEYWRVSLDALAERPVAGLGAGGFGPRYTRVRLERKYASYPHSLFMRAAAEGGAIGILGVLAFMLAATAGLLAGFRRQSAATRTVVAAAGSAAVLFTVHAQFDWLEEFPVLAGPALSFLLVAMVLRRRDDAGPPPGAPRATRLRIAGVAVAGLLAVATLAAPYLAQRYVDRAAAVWRTDVQAAYEDLDRAAALDPLSDIPKLSLGTIALQRREYDRARAAFEAALEREDTWLARFELALIDAAEGDRRAAMRQLEAARRLNPQEPAISAVAQLIRDGEDVDPIRLNSRLFESPLFNARRLT